MGCGASSSKPAEEPKKDAPTAASTPDSSTTSASTAAKPPGSPTTSTTTSSAKYDTTSNPPVIPSNSNEDDEGPAIKDSEAAVVPRRSSLITVMSTRGAKASSSTTTPKLTSRLTEPKSQEKNILPPSTPSNAETDKTSADSNAMFIFGDFNVDPGDVKRQRLERLNRIARPVATLRRRTSAKDLMEERSGAAGGSAKDKEDPVFVLNDFVIKVLDKDIEDSETAGYTFLHEIKVPAGFKQLRSYEYRSLIGCPLRVKSLALLADEQTFMMASIEDAAPVLINAHTGGEVSCFVGHANSITFIVVSKDGKLIATCSRDNTVCIWDAPGVKDNAMRKQNRTLCDSQGAQNAIPLCAAFSFDASCIVVGYQDRVCRVWDLTTRDSMIISIMDEHKGVVVAVAAHPKENICASGSGDKSIFLWRMTEGVIIRRIVGHEGPVLAAHFSLEGDRILSCDSRTCKVWKTDDASSVLTVRLSDLFPNAILAPSPTSNMRRTNTLQKGEVGGGGVGSPQKGKAGSAAAASNSSSQQHQALIQSALNGPHTMATIKKSLESNAAAQNSSFTSVCFAPGMLSNSYFVVSTTLNYIVVVSLATGAEEIRLPTKGPVFSLCQGRMYTVIAGDMFGNVYRLILRAN